MSQMWSGPVRMIYHRVAKRAYGSLQFRGNPNPDTPPLGNVRETTMTKAKIPNPRQMGGGESRSVNQPLWIAAPVQGTGYQFPQVKEQVPPVGRTGHQSRVKEQVTPVRGTGD